MTRVDRLQPALQQADEKERLALLQVAHCQGTLDIELKRLAQLRAYRLEYLQQHGSATAIISPVDMQDFHRFIEQLDRTIEHQQRLVALRERELEQQRKLWKATRLERKKMHRVVENLQREAAVEQRRHEQKADDEFAQRIRKIR